MFSLLFTSPSGSSPVCLQGTEPTQLSSRNGEEVKGLPRLQDRNGAALTRDSAEAVDSGQVTKTTLSLSVKPSSGSSAFLCTLGQLTGPRSEHQGSLLSFPV